MRYWSLLFAAIAVLAVAAFVYAPFNPDWWLPRNVSTQGPLRLGAEVDHLFLLILWITGLVFIGTQVALVYVTWKYAAEPGRRCVYSHGSKRLELIWTLIPGGILLFLAVYQMGSWARIKFEGAGRDIPVLAEVTAEQFRWRIRYPDRDGRLGSPGDLYSINALHLVKDEPAKILLKTNDVLHSFFLPQMRIKQDAVPGLTIPVWFDVDEAGTYDLACAELCGWGHGRMRGVVVVHETRADFERWLEEARAEQDRSQLGPPTETAATSNPTPPPALADATAEGEE